MKLKIKDQIPDTEIFQLIDGEPQKSKLRETIGNGKVVLFGLPGAFTSTCSKLHLPGFVANADKIKAKGIENIFSIPFALILSAFATKPGKWSLEQVDVNAPGKPNKTTLPLPMVSLNLLF